MFFNVNKFIPITNLLQNNLLGTRSPNPIVVIVMKQK